MRLFITYRKACRQRDRKVYRQTEILADRQTGWIPGCPRAKDGKAHSRKGMLDKDIYR